jgi:DnaJ-class molecular chaperone
MTEYAPGTMRCPHCGGSGQIEQHDGTWEDCHLCRGDGWIYTSDAPDAGGKD